jgi:hypothetical protein
MSKPQGLVRLEGLGKLNNIHSPLFILLKENEERTAPNFISDWLFVDTVATIQRRVLGWLKNVKQLLGSELGKEKWQEKNQITNQNPAYGRCVTM